MTVCDAPLARFHVSATGHSLNYLPEYIAARHGFFREQGLAVTNSVPLPWDRVLDDLAEGAADAALGGIWVPCMYRARSTHYSVFAQVSNRTPFAFVQRADDAAGGGPFKWSAMAGRTVLLELGSGASVKLVAQMLAREHGVDPRRVTFVHDLSRAMLLKLFRGGLGDYLCIDLLTARSMAAREPAVYTVAMEMATDCGPSPDAGGADLPWSVYYTETARMTPDAMAAQRRFRAGLRQAIAWILAHDAAAPAFRDELAALFPKAPVDVLVSLTNLYRRCGMWTTPAVSRPGFARWQAGIVDGGLLKAPLAYEEVVDTSAEEDLEK